MSSSLAVNPSFYVTGGTLPLSASSYVTRQADEELYTELRSGQFCYVLNTRQMGKSSLMVRTARRLKEDGDAVAVLDLTSVGLNLTAEQWYDGLLVRLGEQVNLEDALDDFWLAHHQLGPMQRFIEAIRQVVLPALPSNKANLILFVDEIDAVRSLPFSADEFFVGIRECYNRRAIDPLLERLTFCLLGVATPGDLITDMRVSPFNIGQRIELMDFTLEEALPLAWGLGIDRHKLLQRILYWTGGHPYLTQRLCSALAEEVRPTLPQVDGLCHRMFLNKTARDSDDNLQFVRNRLLRDPYHSAERVLDLYAEVRAGKPVQDDDTNPLVSILHLSGIVRSDSTATLKVRNRIYERVFNREWILENLPQVELMIQREAVQRAHNRVVSTSIVIAFIALFGLLLFWNYEESKFQTAVSETDKAKTAYKQLKTDFNNLTNKVDKQKAILSKYENDFSYSHLNNAIYFESQNDILLLARYYYDNGYKKEALKAYSDGIKKDKTNLEMYLGRSLTYLALADYFNAIADTKRMIAIDPNYWKAYLLQSLIYDRYERKPLARKSLKRILAGKAYSAHDHFCRGKAAMELIRLHEPVIPKAKLRSIARNELHQCVQGDLPTHEYREATDYLNELQSKSRSL